jgi:hypothetical protein
VHLFLPSFNSPPIISTNNIATGMVRGGRKYAFNPPKVRFSLNIKLPTNATGKSKKTVWTKKKKVACILLDPTASRTSSALLLPLKAWFDVSGGLYGTKKEFSSMCT